MKEKCRKGTGKRERTRERQEGRKGRGERHGTNHSAPFCEDILQEGGVVRVGIYESKSRACSWGGC